MKSGYHLQTNLHALNALKVDVDLPKAELGIEYAENHSFYTIKFIIEKNQPRVVIPELDELPIEYATVDQQGKLFTDADFPKNHYIGSSLGGI
jgi:hypothetical protein